MVTSVSVVDKKNFLIWFTKNQNIKNWQNLRILQCLADDPELLSNIHFVRTASYCPRHFLVTECPSKELLFHYYKQDLMITDIEKIFHDIRLNKHKPLYIQLEFNKSNQSPHYVAVLETNPYTPHSAPMTEEDNYLIEQLFTETYYKYKKNLLKQELDMALDAKDQTTFKALSNKLHLLETKKC